MYMLSPSLVLITFGAATRLKVGVGEVSTRPGMSVAEWSPTLGSVPFFAHAASAAVIRTMRVRFISASSVDADFGHHPAEILGVVAEEVEIGRVEEIRPRREAG